ncbi:hypothetical protein [Nitrosospira multiformis]|uniref:Uncharacterized protein n=1 Tax=Nitrosospira multiformis TaxID=1231 RepID=A0A1I7GZM3_9PROT|nr:hypothetical protein [Nitrosospira multiformis]SFU53850.1 hypothetical protein SAMN05216417_106126 [Nitrosospira multiformis]
MERNDKPCYVGALTENVNNSKDITGEIKSLCGNNPTSKEMKVQFGGIKFAERTFVRALRVCMNKDNTRIKGLQIRGRMIDENGNVADLPARYPDSSSSSGLTPLGGFKRTQRSTSQLRWLEKMGGMLSESDCNCDHCSFQCRIESPQCYGYRPAMPCSE